MVSVGVKKGYLKSCELDLVFLWSCPAWYLSGLFLFLGFRTSTWLLSSSVSSITKSFNSYAPESWSCTKTSCPTLSSVKASPTSYFPCWHNDSCGRSDSAVSPCASKNFQTSCQFTAICSWLTSWSCCSTLDREYPSSSSSVHILSDAILPLPLCGIIHAGWSHMSLSLALFLTLILSPICTTIWGPFVSTTMNGSGSNGGCVVVFFWVIRTSLPCLISVILAPFLLS